MVVKKDTACTCGERGIVATMLTRHAPIAFIPTTQPAAARAFYEGTLGLRFVSDDPFAMVFRIGPGEGTMLRILRAPHFTPLPFTIFGWEVSDMQGTVAELADKGVVFERFESLDQDEQGIWNAPGGARVVWFKDPDGNTLSLSQHG
jgi:catechol 2,3-dioxygenase-like lactoylglutathione lyase family enzyme